MTLARMLGEEVPEASCPLGPWEGDASGVKAQFGAGTMQALLLPVVIAPFLTFIATHFVYKTTGINSL